MTVQSQEIQDLVHQWFAGLRESNSANREVVINGNLIYELRDQHRQYINELTDSMTSEDRMVYLEEQINIINSQIVYYAKQEREWRIIRDQKAEEIRQIKSSNSQAAQRIDEILKNGEPK